MSAPVRLGLRENLGQFSLLAVVNACCPLHRGSRVKRCRGESFLLGGEHELGVRVGS
jgi:hypothetical protein